MPFAHGLTRMGACESFRKQEDSARATKKPAPFEAGLI